jgi:predicted DNA-binding protein
MSDDTSIRLDKRVRDRLKARGSKGETYTEIIDRLLDETEDTHHSVV